MSGRGGGGRGGRGRGRGRGRGGGGNAGTPGGAPEDIQNIINPPTVVKEPGPLFPPRSDLPKRVPPTEEEVAYLQLTARINETIRTKPYYYTIPTLEEISNASNYHYGDNESFAISALVEQREPITQYLSHVAHFFPDELFQLAAAKAKRKRKVVSVKKKRDELEELQRTDEKLDDDEILAAMMQDGEQKLDGEEEEEEGAAEEEAELQDDDELEFEVRSDDDDMMDDDDGGGDDEGIL